MYFEEVSVFIFRLSEVSVFMDKLETRKEKYTPTILYKLMKPKTEEVVFCQFVHNYFLSQHSLRSDQIRSL